MLRLSGLRAASKKKTHAGHSLQWMTRHVKDRYVQRAQEDGYRSRSAYKLKQIDTKFSIMKSRDNVVDLGCWCGGWSQVALQRTRAGSGSRPGMVIGVDLVALEPLENLHFIQGDIRDAAVLRQVLAKLGERKADVVLSDMAPKGTGMKYEDHMASIDLCREAMKFAEAVLKEQGVFVTKVFDGALADRFKKDLEARFARVRVCKPPATRSESREVYYVAKRFYGLGKFGPPAVGGGGAAADDDDDSDTDEELVLREPAR